MARVNLGKVVPEKGVDYFTEAEKAAMVQEVKEEINLTDYVKNTDYPTSSKGGAIKTGYGLNAFSTGTPYCTEMTYSTYQSQQGKFFISKATLENVITGKELVNKTYVDNIVGDIESILEELDIGGGI